jgi:hypothetical protein
MPLRATGRYANTAVVPATTTSTWTYVARFCRGYWLDGKARTDATFCRAATPYGALTKGRLGRWSYLAGYQRAAIRLGAVTLAFGALILRITDPTALATILRWLFWSLAPILAMAGWLRIRERGHRRDHYEGLCQWYATYFSVALHEARKRVHIPVGHRKDARSCIRIELPGYYVATAAEQERLAERIAAKVGLNDPDWSIDFTGRPTLTMSLVPRPPKTISMSDWQNHARRAN